ncbi:MAG TPA: FAD-dependent monooxygenase [Usitatibacter sp.]|nr:FAD-dependent monooxygenase [Usitatibacter sp.]
MTMPRLLIAGGGPVGLSLACALRGFEVHVLEAAAQRPPPVEEGYDTRVYALSPGTRSFLRDIGAWEHLDPARVAAVRRMEIFGDRDARLTFNGPAGSALAWILEAGRLTEALEIQAASLPSVSIVRGASVRAMGGRAGKAWVELGDGVRLEGDLLVGADGADSPVRAAAGIAADESAYGESAIVANFATENPHGASARQWFREDGVLAWLPLPGNHISIVWSTPDAYADTLCALEPRSLERRVRDAGQSVLGDLRLISPVGRFPLRIIRVAQPVAEGVALIGDAAHAVHPLAGQGVNLGFQDARVLADELVERSPVERPGDLRVLRRYARARREDVTAMQFVTDRLDQLFATDVPGAASLRNAGLRMVQAQPWIKGMLSGRAMR